MQRKIIVNLLCLVKTRLLSLNIMYVLYNSYNKNAPYSTLLGGVATASVLEAAASLETMPMAA